MDEFMYLRNYTMYYVLYNNEIESETTIAQAFSIVTKKSRVTHEGEYLKFLYNLIKNGSITSWFRSDKVSDDFIFNLTKNNKRVLAMKLYRDSHNITLTEAKFAVEGMLELESK